MGSVYPNATSTCSQATKHSLGDHVNIKIESTEEENTLWILRKSLRTRSSAYPVHRIR